MNRALILAAPLACMLMLLAQTSNAQCATCPTPVTTFYAPQTYQVCQPVVPAPVVVEQPRRCCLSRFCDWLWGRSPQTVVAAAPAVQTVSYAPATCAPSCCPAPCSACAADCSSCPSCTSMPAPALSSNLGARSTYAAYNGAPYGNRSSVQQANYTYAAASTNYGSHAAAQSTPRYYGQTAQPTASYPYQSTTPQRAAYQAPRVQTQQQPAPSTLAPQRAVPQDRTASNLYTPIQRAAYQAPVAQAIAKPTYIRPVTQPATISWSSGTR